MQVLFLISSPAFHSLHRLAVPIKVLRMRVALSYLYLTCFPDLEARICDIDHQLEVDGAEVATWKRYKVGGAEVATWKRYKVGAQGSRSVTV